MLTTPEDHNGTASAPPLETAEWPGGEFLDRGAVPNAALVKAATLLRGIKDYGTLLSLHSLERQRSDLTSEVSRKIEAIERSGLREARTVLFHEPGTAEVARHWVPECADRSTNVRQPFSVQQFESNRDPAEVKARYQIGPVDPTILYIGDLSERYGPDLLLKAMPAVLKNNQQAR